MSIPTYRPGFPQDGSSLGSTKTQIRNNLDGTFLTLGVDHINNNGAPGTGTPGYHNVVHWQDQGSLNPSPIAGVTQEYTKTDTNSIQQKWLESTAGNTYQQTRMIDGSFATFAQNIVNYNGNINMIGGWTYIAGGMLLQYGIRVTSMAGGIIIFPTPFTVGPFMIQLTPFTTDDTIKVVVNSAVNPTATQFQYLSSGNATGTYWLAIGV